MVKSYSLRAGLLEDLVALHTEASTEGEYEVAFHLLMAALHLAEGLGDRAALDRISGAAEDDARAVEALRPAHNLSASRALVRGQTSVFESLQTHVNAVKARLRATAR